MPGASSAETQPGRSVLGIHFPPGSAAPKTRVPGTLVLRVGDRWAAVPVGGARKRARTENPSGIGQRAFGSRPPAVTSHSGPAT